MIQSQNVIVKGNKIYLKDIDYKASGGQGSLYLKNGILYKIYHDITTLIPEQKIYELQELSPINNIIIPQNSIYNISSERIGFTLEYVNNAEYLCKLFTMSFKNRNSLTIKNIADVVDNMRDTLIKIHERNIIVGDYNEMNFLIDTKFEKVFHIDTDSWQTKSYKCNAIMHSVRDRTLPLGEFKESSDWFSWAVITFQLYIGLHPYKGRHQYDFEKRMDNNISVFNKEVKIPKNIDFNFIPKNHLDYYKNVFINKDRSVPPKSQGASNIQIIRKVFIDDEADIKANLLFEYDSDILDVIYRNNARYVLTKKSIYENNKIIDINNSISKLIFSSDETIIKDIGYKDYIATNNILYHITENGLAQVTYEKIGKIIPIEKYVSTLNYNSSQLFDGVVLQDIFGKYTATIPYKLDKCINIKITELSNSRIIDAKYQHGWLFIVYNKNNLNKCLIIKFNKDYSYKSSIIENIDFLNLNILVKTNGVVIFNTEDCKLELFSDLGTETKIFNNTPIYNDCKLVELHKTCFIHNNKLFELNN